MEKFAPFSAEAWGYAAQMTILGMGMIFAVLALLWLVLSLFKFVFVGKSEESKNKESNKAEDTPREEMPVAPAVSEVVDDATTAAVITAAIAAYMAEQGVSQDGFRVVSFKRANTRAWNNK